MAKVKTSFICTVLNEEKTVGKLLESLSSQTVKPDEIILVDGGSTDKTLSVISNFKFQISNKPIKIFTKRGNRAVGRNFAIEKAQYPIILCSDAGCVLDKNWVKNITKSFAHKADVVAGYYKGVWKTFFQKSLIPYVLVMPDRVTDDFLPASRSMAFTKSIWKKAGKFPHAFSHNEDYVFARRLKEKGAHIVFARNAIVHWTPPDNLISAFIMFYRFAVGDMESGIIRPKVVLIFVRYLIGVLLYMLAPLVFLMAVVLYMLWSIAKNYRYVEHISSIVYLPALQLISDSAVLFGSTIGFLMRFVRK